MLCIIGGFAYKGTAFQAPRALEWEASFPSGWVLLHAVVLPLVSSSVLVLQAATQRNCCVIYLDTKIPGCFIKVSPYISKIRKQRDLKLLLHISNDSSKSQVHRLNTNSSNL